MGSNSNEHFLNLVLLYECMRTFFLNAKSKIDVVIPKKVIKELPERIGIIVSVQLLHEMEKVLDQIKGAVPAGQVLGCNAVSAVQIKDQVDAFLFVGSGVFHPINVAWQTGKEIYCFNPYTKEFKKLDKKLITKHEKRKKGAILKFMHAKRVGIIVSTKIGQANLKRALQLKKQTDKEYHIFVCDTLNFADFADFNFIDCWVNTSCPRIVDEKEGLVNINDLVAEGLVKFPKIKEGYDTPIWMSTKGLSK